MTQLERFLEEIDPKYNIDLCSSRLDKAINSYEYRGARIKTIEEYENIMGDFYWHANTVMYGNPDKFSTFPH